MNTKLLINKIQKGEYDDRLLDIYVDNTKLCCQKERYIHAIKEFENYYGFGEVTIFSAPGRSEVGGNHTDHQHGMVLAASVNLDMIGIVRATDDRMIRVVSEKYGEILISLDDSYIKEEEQETTVALIKGIIAGFIERNYSVGGFCAYITSDVLIGVGLSSSAAFEILIGTILSGLYNNMSISPVEIAMIGQYAENVYFGKPCGLMDQMACSVGNLVYIDFKHPNKPKVEKINADMDTYGYSLCITDTKGSHAALTDEYAAVPKEMKLVASYFGKEVLREVTFVNVLTEIDTLRTLFGDRCVLRAIHFITENERVEKEVNALKNGNMEMFLKNVKASGNSSFKYLQNVYSNKDITNQNLSVALMISETVLNRSCQSGIGQEQILGVCRVHGGGFAGTIQAFVKNEYVNEYKKIMNQVFGEGSCNNLKIRKYGGIQVI